MKQFPLSLLSAQYPLAQIGHAVKHLFPNHWDCYVVGSSGLWEMDCTGCFIALIILPLILTKNYVVHLKHMWCWHGILRQSHEVDGWAGGKIKDHVLGE
jgi:hypothetical protein